MSKKGNNRAETDNKTPNPMPTNDVGGMPTPSDAPKGKKPKKTYN